MFIIYHSGLGCVLVCCVLLPFLFLPLLSYFLLPFLPLFPFSFLSSSTLVSSLCLLAFTPFRFCFLFFHLPLFTSHYLLSLCLVYFLSLPFLTSTLAPLPPLASFAFLLSPHPFLARTLAFPLLPLNIVPLPSHPSPPPLTLL